MAVFNEYFAHIGARGGRKSRRTLDPAAARAMVRVREARRAFRRFHGECFKEYDPAMEVTLHQVGWVAERLRDSGSETARQIGARLILQLAGASLRPGSDTTADSAAVHLDAIRSLPPGARLQQALDHSQAMRHLALHRLRRRHPELSELELTELLLGVELVPAFAR